MGFKIGSTAIIWGFSTGMLAICTPLVSLTESGVILPLAVIIGATISTVFVWLSSPKQSQNSTSIADIKNKIEDELPPE